MDLQELANLPHGKAAKIIRATIDPLWGTPAGDKREYQVSGYVTGYARVKINVEATSHEEAEALALDRICDEKLVFDPDFDDLSLDVTRR